MKRILGFTLLEAMLSVGLFGIVMAILFGAINGFQKGWLKEYGKQAVSSQFVKIYRAIDSDVAKSNNTYFHSYIEEDTTKKETRWFMFPVSKSGLTSNGEPYWTELVVYRLEIPKNDKCINSASPDKFNVYCPHKNLVRHRIKIGNLPLIIDSRGKNQSFNMFIKESVKNIETILNTKTNDSVLLNIGGHNVNNDVIDVHVVQNDILDLTVVANINKQIKFDAKFVRMIDAQKNLGKSGLTLGERELLTDDGDIKDDMVKRYIEEVSWISITNNV